MVEFRQVPAEYKPGRFQIARETKESPGDSHLSKGGEVPFNGGDHFRGHTGTRHQEIKEFRDERKETGK